MKNQAQFHPLHYLKHLAEAVLEAGGKIYENTAAKEIKEGDRPKVLTRNGHQIFSDYVACCTHFPFHDKKASILQGLSRAGHTCSPSSRKRRIQAACI